MPVHARSLTPRLPPRQSSPGRFLLAVLLVALAHGLVYVFLIPPWQHYDEPNHFEYAWLLANRHHLPQAGEFDLGMRREVQASMYAHNFFRGMELQPDPAADRPWIGTFDQSDDPPLYYGLVALVLSAFVGTEVTLQLYVARLVSLALFLMTVVAAWGLAAEITPPRSPLRWGVPFTLALLPAFVDLMTSLNNDVGAAACMAWFLWGGARLVKRGFSWGGLVWTLLAMGAGLFTKRTAYVAFPLLVVALWLMLWRGGRIRWAWAALVGGALLPALVALAWGDATLWYRKTLQALPTRLSWPAAPLGEHAFRLQVTADDPAPQLVQFLPLESGRSLRGKTLTLGAWIWADHPARIESPALFVYDSQQRYSQPIDLGTVPQFYAFTLAPAGNPYRSWVIVNAAPAAGSVPLEVYFDGLVLAEGQFPAATPPVFDSATGERGLWGGVPFENLLRNPSAESAWPYLRPWADQLGSRLFPDYGQDRLSLAVYSLADYPATGWYYRYTVANLLRTFWAKFGWGQVPLPGAKPYRILAVVTLLATLGAVGYLGWGWLSRRQRWPWSTLLWLGLALVAVWGLTFVRGSNYIFWRPFVPNARYAVAAILPTALALNAGWWALYRPWQRWLRLPAWGYACLYALGLALLDGLSVLAIIRFYYG